MDTIFTVTSAIDNVILGALKPAGQSSPLRDRLEKLLMSSWKIKQFEILSWNKIDEFHIKVNISFIEIGGDGRLITDLITLTKYNLY